MAQALSQPPSGLCAARTSPLQPLQDVLQLFVLHVLHVLHMLYGACESVSLRLLLRLIIARGPSGNAAAATSVGSVACRSAVAVVGATMG